MPSGDLQREHLLILGATGATGVIFVSHVLSLDNSTGPMLTLYVRPSAQHKLPGAAHGHPRVRIVEGALTNRAKLVEALSPSSDSSFPKATAVISLLGAYPSLYYLLTRQTPTPIADAFEFTILPVMKEVGVRRILALSTGSGFLYPQEREKLTWGWWFKLLPPKVMVPQGDAEMRAIAEVVMRASGGLEWTVFRVPFLTNDDQEKKISVGEIFKDFDGTNSLARPALVKWLLREVGERGWVGRAPMVADAVA